MLIYGAGVGFAISQLTSATLLEIPIPRIGQASGLSSTARQIGSAVGVAVLTAIMSGVLAATLGDRLAASAPEIPEAQRTVVAQVIASSPADPSASAIFGTLPPSSLAGVQQATESSLALGVRIAALAAAVPIAGAWFLARRLPSRRRDGVAEPADSSGVSVSAAARTGGSGVVGPPTTCRNPRPSGGSRIPAGAQRRAMADAGRTGPRAAMPQRIRVTGIPAAEAAQPSTFRGAFRMVAGNAQSQALGDAGARNLADVTKTVPQMATITPRWLVHMLAWVPVEAGIYRVNKVKHPEEVDVVCSNYDESPAADDVRRLRGEPARVHPATRCPRFSMCTPGSRICTRARTTRSRNSCG